MRYVLRPGWVTSQHDGDRHYITAAMLRDLYLLSVNDHVIVDGDPKFPPYRRQPGDVILTPRFDGRYPEWPTDATQ
jgi:hypothetical protein